MKRDGEEDHLKNPIFRTGQKADGKRISARQAALIAVGGKMKNWGMPASLVALALTICGWSDLLAAQSPTPIPTATPGPKFSPYPDLDQVGCYWATDHDQADLCAQWQAARAANRTAESATSANLIASLSLLLSAIGMVGVFVTVWFTKESLSEARKAAAAAERAASETQRIGEAQVRCYLAITSAELKIRSSDNRPVVGFEVKNFGQSPATGLRFGVQLAYAKRKNLKKKRLCEPSFHERHSFLAPGAKIVEPRTAYRQPLQQDEVDACEAGDLAAVVRIVITGEDVFGKPIYLEGRFSGINFGLDEEVELDHLSYKAAPKG